MNNETVTINEFFTKFIEELRRVGYCEQSIYSHFYPHVRTIVRYFEGSSKTYYSIGTADEFIKCQHERWKRKEISDTSYRANRSIAMRMNEFFITGELRIAANKHGTVYVISAEHENLIDRFIAWKRYGQNTRDDVRWTVRKYLYYLEHLGHTSLEDVFIDEVRKFILETAATVRASSLHNILLYLKYFHMFLSENNIPAPDCIELFSYKVYREMPVQSYVTDDELEKIFSVIDRTKLTGKRDYAIIQVAATTGLRASDIIALKCSDIYWQKGEIRISQKKTGRDVVLPLIYEASEALQDYLLNGRPETQSDHLFLRVAPPNYPICDAASVGDMFKRYQRRCGLTRQALDGKGFHGLRRRLAKKLLVSGTSMTSIAQILGHDDVDSVRQYLSLDTSNLKECALGFSGIEVERKELMS